jgi:aspartyl-tRNA(Asn)/glutamyl-tRNA(Gln) amidotransferase subunit B
LLKLVDAGTINITTGKTLLQTVQESGTPPEQLVREKGLAQVRDDAAIRAICEQVIQENPNEVTLYRGGKDTLIGWFVGQVMRASHGKADAQAAKEILVALLSQ